MTDTAKDTNIRVLKLQETHADAQAEQSDAMSMFRIWTLLTNGAGTRDLTVMNRAVL